MQSTFYTASNSHYFPSPWKSPEPNFTVRKSIHYKPQNRFKILTFTNSLRIPLGYEPEEGVEQVSGPRPEPASRVVYRWWFGNPVGFLGTTGMGIVCNWFVWMVVRRRFRSISMMGFGKCSDFVVRLSGISSFQSMLVGIIWTMWSGSFCIEFSARRSRCLPLR